ncbi:hypothetical protein BDF19DRAFT_448958 [Syncephalis fuscata]|nr:hypothetical protein BDF19DRAFT_448958 [Syncephalis fuscata]
MFHRMHDVRRDSEVEKYVFNFYFIKLPFTAILFGIIVNIILGGHLICLLLISFQCLVFVLMTLGFDVDYQRNLSLTIGLALTNYYTLQWGKSMRRHIGRGRVIFIRCSCYILWALYFAAGVISTTVVTVPLFYFLTEVGISWAIVACTAHGIYMAGAFYSIGITIWYFTLLPKAAPLHDRIKKTVRLLIEYKQYTDSLFSK